MTATHVRRRGPLRRARGLGGLVVAGLLLVLVRGLLVEPLRVDGVSMEPGLQDRDVVLVWRRADVEHDTRRGDLVVFHDPDGTLSVKRVVGLPGDRVRVLDSVLEIDERAVLEPYARRSTATSYFGTLVVPARTVFVLGDNRARSTDSRVYGPVDDARVVGRVVLSW